MTDILVTSPHQPFTLPTQLKAVFNGYIYCGTVDAVDPSVSQVQVYLVNESGDKVPVAQPLRTNAGGYLVYNGQPAKFVTDSNHSLLVKDSFHVQVWYEPDMAKIDPGVVWDLITADDGSKWIGFIQYGAGSVTRTSLDKMRERITPQDKGAVGDGVTNDTAAFVKLEEDHPAGQEIDMLGKTYFVDAPFYGHKYYNGLWAVTGDTSRPRWQGAQLTGAGRIVFGDEALVLLPESYSMGETGTVIAMGYGAMGKMTQVKKAIAIGPNSQAEGSISRDNISIGEDSLRFVQSRTPDYDQAQQQGTRNIAIGGNAGRFIYEGIRDIAIGRNAGQCLVNSIGATIVGSNAAGGYAPIGFTGGIENWAPNNDPIGVTAFGAEALGRVITGFNVAVGNNSSGNLVAGRNNVTVGVNALANAEVGSGFNGNQKADVSVSGTYSHSGNTLTLNFVGHGAVVGGIVGVRLLDGGSQTFQGDVVPAVVLSATANSLTVNHPVSRTASGSAQLYWTINTTPANKSESNCVLGSNSLNSAAWANENVAVGHNAITNANDPSASVSRNVAVGFRALSGWTSPINMTAVGHDALRFMQNGSVATGAGLNSTGIGRSSRVSGDNQVQLGDASTTTYVYGTVQNRSDARDKADLRPTTLGDDFIDGLEAEEGFWDMRDDYFEEYEQQVGIDPKTGEPIFETRLRALPKDGSKKRNRKHQWFVAQKVKALCDELGLDFGGLQDHSVNGGCDVMSLGYDEFIPPLTAYVKRRKAEIRALEGTVSSQQMVIDSLVKRLDKAGL